MLELIPLQGLFDFCFGFNGSLRISVYIELSHKKKKKEKIIKIIKICLEKRGQRKKSHTCGKHSRAFPYYHSPVMPVRQKCAGGMATLKVQIIPVSKKQSDLGFSKPICPKNVGFFTVDIVSV